ncbi:MAG: hypothetical protein GY724_08870 [Actinomycetia bacterium]|nr:hypothetical protein [Actinomycetes bacterium]MCP4226254.1 hypothetical protein [Actinomycetes bacterium]MCP5030619.1 hypothetical protein [Actinomycetes bacterium]
MFPFDGAAAPDQDTGSAAERGAGLVEYALLVSLIVLVCIAAVQLLGGTTSDIYSSAVVGFE